MPVLSETTDAAGGVSTSYSMSAGDYFFGNLSTGTESDWIEVSLQAGQTYTFGLVGVGALDDAANDTYLRLHNSAGTEINASDDDGPGRNSAITFTATTAGTYYLDVGSYIGAGSGDSGDYGLSMVTGTRASYDVTMGAGNLLRPSASWASSSGTAASVTWSIRASGDDGNGFIAPSAAQTGAIEEIMALFDGVSGLNFTQVNPGGTSNNATMVFGAYSANDGAGAYAYYPGSTSSTSDAGDVWLNNNSVSTGSLPIGSYSYFALMHEVGHAVGLAHPGDYNAAPGVSITYSNNAQFIEDTHQYTVMSYFDESNTTNSMGSYPDTLLLFDLYALHQQYGADMSFHAGDTVYGFNATVGGAYDFTSNTDPFLSIWDGGGTDTLDLSGYGMAQLIDLREGQFSNIGGFTGNLSIAIGAVIENAVGGAGNDIITGNSAANSLSGGSGADTLIGGSGADTLVGEAGNDTVSYAGTTTGVGARLGGLSNWAGAAGDLIYSVENLIGSDHADWLVGDSGANRLDGGDGDDMLRGWSGDDTLIGGQGADTLEGGNGADSLSGGSGADTLIGGSGADTLVGEAGNDTVSYAGTTTGVGARLGGLSNWAGAAGDLIYSVENLIGSDHADWLVGDSVANRLDGGDGDDMLRGWSGDDTLIGGQGADTLEGGNGADSLSGGSGADTLIGGSGADTLVGEAGNDTVSYAGTTTGVGARLGGLSNWAGAAGDLIYSVENLIGSDHADWLVGDSVANRLDGGDGDDMLRGWSGDDTLIGGQGADTLEGGNGNDVFVFADGFGQDVVRHFKAANDADRIDLSAVSSITGFADLIDVTAPHMMQVGADVVIDDFSGNTITLENVNLGDLDANDFVF